MRILNALQIKNGAKVDSDRMKNLTQPLQFVSTEEKDSEWGAWNMDWIERQGIKQIRQNARRLTKNYKLANGIIDRSDYIVEDDNETAELIDTLVDHNDNEMLQLKFFPIIPSIVNVMVGEFAKRNDKIMYRGVDDDSFNEMMDAKYNMIEQTLVNYGEQKMMQTAMNAGIDLESEQGQQMLSPENIKTLPEIEEFFQTDYQSLSEQWATHQHIADSERFDMEELELIAFRDSIVSDREFWHFDMGEDDYTVELWNPLLTFYHKSPETRYISQGNYVGKIDIMTVSDVIDKYGYKMTKEQMESLEEYHGKKAVGYALPDMANDGSFYDTSRSHKWNTEGDSLGMRQFNSVNEQIFTDDVLDEILNGHEDYSTIGDKHMIRVTTAYWKSQRPVGILKRIDESGMAIDMIVDDSFKITTEPEYDTALYKEKSHENLIYGEHVEWIWINETYGGIKIGNNKPSTEYDKGSDPDGLDPIYLDMKPLKFQFKGDYSLYGCKLPVEGAVFTDRNSKSISLVDTLKPNQIGYNMVNNQIMDILIDEIGTVVLIDQNTMPKSSMGEDWGENNFSKAFVAMKDFQMLPVDTSISNTENPLNFSHYQTLNLEQTQRLMSRINLAQYFKQQAFESVGMSPQRMGEVLSQETATGVEQAVNASHAQTEIYFIQHSEQLMKRVHEMRTNLAQWYNSHKPSVRLQYLTKMEEKINFQINGTELLLKDINVFATSKVSHKAVMEQIRMLALNNNTSGASIYDLGSLIKAESVAEIDSVLKTVEIKVQKQRNQEMQAQKDLEESRQQNQQTIEKAKLDFEANQNDLDRQNKIDVAEVRASGYQVGDLNNNEQSDYLDSIEYLDKKRQRGEDMAFSREKENHKRTIDNQKINIERERLSTQKEVASKQLEIARTNKNQYDVKKSKKKDK